MRALILYTVVLLTCAQNVKLIPIENNEVPVDSIFEAEGNELDSDVVHEIIEPSDPDEQVDDNPNDSDVNINEEQFHDDVADNNEEEGVSNDDGDIDDEVDIDMLEKMYGIEIPICAQYAEVTYPLQVSHLTDCGKFYKCSNGRGYLFDCPKGQDWSVKFDRCDYPEIAGCTIDGTHQFKLQKQIKPKKASGNDEEDEEDDENDDEFGEFEIDPRCEGSDPFTPYHYNHPDDCSKYYKCYLGKAYVIKCPKGQNWSQRLNRCDHPALARCFIVKPAKLGQN
jgi:hypothetical protein